MAIGGDGRAHVIWYLPREIVTTTRSDSERSQFEVQRSLVSDYVEGIDAAADIAAEGDQVAVAWGAGALSAEQERTVYARFRIIMAKALAPSNLSAIQTSAPVPANHWQPNLTPAEDYQLHIVLR